MPKNTPIRIIDSQRARGAVFLGGGATSGGVIDHGALLGLGDNDHPQYVLTTTTVEAGAGLTGGGALSAGALTLAVGAGNMITVGADAIALVDGTGTYQFIGTGSGTSGAWHSVSEFAGDGLTHTTALNVGVSGLGLSVGADAVTLTSSSDVSAGTTAILASNAGALTVASLYATTRLSSSLIDTTISNITLKPAGDLILDPTGNDVLPQSNYDINLGAINLKYLTLHAAELWVETLVAQNTIATIGGRILVGPTTTLTRDLAAAGTTIYVKHNEMASGDRVYMEADGKIEFFAITSSATSTGTDYSYTVTRNLDGTGANQWYAGDAMFNTGTTGEGFIDLYSLHGVKAGTEYGPTIVGNVRLSATYNDWEERWAIGNLNGLYDYGTTVYGFAAGAPTGANVTVDATNGVRLRQGTTDTIVLSPSGASYFAGVMTIDTNGEIRQGDGTLGSNYTGLRIWRDTGVGRIGGYNTNVLQWWAGTDGKLYAGNGYVGLNRDGAQIDRTTWTYTSSIPEPGYGSTPDLSPNVETALRFRDQAATFYRTGSPFQYTYPGNTILRMYTSSKHVIPTDNMGVWAHYMDGIIEMPAITEAGDPSVYTRYLRLIAPSILLTGPVFASSSLSVAGEINVRQHTSDDAWSLDAANGTTLVLTSNSVYQPSSTSVFSGLIIVNDATNGSTGMFLCGGGVVVEVGDTGSTFGIAVGTANSINVYWDGSSQYLIKNTFAATHTLNIFTIRMRAAS